jgi:hypothetical protein
MRFIELSIVEDPYAQDVQKFTWRSQKGLIKIHRHWAKTPDRQQLYFGGQEIVTIEENPKTLDWTQAFASYYGLSNNP